MKLIESDRKHGQKYRKRQHVKILLTCQYKGKYLLHFKEMLYLITLFG